MRRHNLRSAAAALALLLTSAAGAAGQKHEIEIWCMDDVIDHRDVQLLIEEFPGACSAACPADLNGNGEVGVNDLQHILARFGECREPCDVTGDGIVDRGDLAQVATDRDAELDCTPDVDHSGWVDSFDLLVVRSSIAGDPDADPDADVDRDGVTDSADEQAVASAFTRDCRSDIDRDGTVDTSDLDQICDLFFDSDFCS